MYNPAFKQATKRGSDMGIQTLILVFCSSLLSGVVLAQDSADFKAGYAKGYQDGLDAAMKKGPDGVKAPATDTAKEAPKQAIRVGNAVYGPVPGKTCSATGFVGSMANGKQTATISVGNGMCGDPEPGKTKTLTVYYLCTTGPEANMKIASGPERGSVNLNCN